MKHGLLFALGNEYVGFHAISSPTITHRSDALSIPKQVELVLGGFHGCLSRRSECPNFYLFLVA